MSVSFAVEHEVQAYDVGFRSNYASRPTAVKDQRDLPVAIKRTARVAPHGRERAEPFSAIGRIDPRRSAQLVTVAQAHGGAARNVSIHFLAPLLSRQDCDVPCNPCAEFPCGPIVSAHRSALAELSSARAEK